MLVVTRFDVPEDEAATFLGQAQAALSAFAARPGYLRGRVGRAADDPTAWVLTTEWVGVGAYRRSLSAYDVKVDAAPLLARGRDEPSAFELLVTDDGTTASELASSGRAADASTSVVGGSSGPSVTDPPAAAASDRPAVSDRPAAGDRPAVSDRPAASERPAVSDQRGVSDRPAGP